jgi:general secretion pathway protein H
MRARGFTLIEMLVVLAIMAVAMAAVPSLLTSLQGVRLRAAADDLTAGLRDAHSQAISRRTMTEFLLDPTQRLYRVSSQPAPQAWPPVIQALEVSPTTLSDPDGTIRIRFFPDGTASAGRLVLRHGTGTIVLAIDWLTGSVHRDE